MTSATPTPYRGAAAPTAKLMTPTPAELTHAQLLEARSVHAFEHRRPGGPSETIVELHDAHGLVIARTVIVRIGDREAIADAVLATTPLIRCADYSTDPLRGRTRIAAMVTPTASTTHVAYEMQRNAAREAQGLICPLELSPLEAVRGGGRRQPDSDGGDHACAA